MLVYGECECFVKQMLYVCGLCASCGSSQCYVLHDLQFVNAGRGCNRRPYRRGILQSRSHNCFIGSHECLLLFTPSCCSECFYEVPLSMSLLGFGMGTMLANFDMCGIMLMLRAVFNMLVRNANPRGPKWLGARCLVCQHLVMNCYFYFVLLPLGHELW